MKCWQKLLLAVSIITLIVAVAIFVLDYKKDKKLFGIAMELLEKRKLIQL